MTFDEWLKSVTPEGHTHIAPEDLRAAWDESRRVALEEAAKRLGLRALSLLGQDAEGDGDWVDGLEDAANVIRALAAEQRGTK